MNFKPILFSTAMVRALLDNRKTQTRRIVKPQPDDNGLHDHDRFPMHVFDDATGWWGTTEDTGEGREFKCRYGQIGDVLWVRETWNEFYVGGGDDRTFAYKASDPEFPFEGWRPSIFMPKAVCRLFLEITDIRVERVQDISEEDAIAEGVECWIEEHVRSRPTHYKLYYTEPGEDSLYSSLAYHSYESLWQKINGPESWKANPWVWAITFNRIDKPLNFLQ